MNHCFSFPLLVQFVDFSNLVVNGLILFVGWKALNTWKHQVKSDKQYEHAVEAIVSLHALLEKMKVLRAPIHFQNIYISNDEEIIRLGCNKINSVSEPIIPIIREYLSELSLISSKSKVILDDGVSEKIDGFGYFIFDYLKNYDAHVLEPKIIKKQGNWEEIYRLLVNTNYESKFNKELEQKKIEVEKSLKPYLELRGQKN